MNFVGKIFIVLIFVMSLVFMSLALAVYAKHQNWRLMVESTKKDAQGIPIGSKYKLERQEAINKTLKDQHDKEKAELIAKLTDKENAMVTLQDKYKNLARDHEELTEQAKVLDKKDKVSVTTL